MTPYVLTTLIALLCVSRALEAPAMFNDSSRATLYENSAQHRLYSSLMKLYNKNLRPVSDPSKHLRVDLYNYLYQIFEVDQKKNTITISGSLEMYWHDDFLQWNPDEFGGVAELHLPADKVWIPEISVYYSPTSSRMLQSDTDMKVTHRGRMSWFVPFTVVAFCGIDVKNFPFDEQTCHLIFGPWAYTTEYLDFNPLNSDLRDYYENQEWVLGQPNFTSTVFAYSYLGGEFNYTFSILSLPMRRESFYYVFNLVCPTAITAYVAVIGFHMPGTSGPMRYAKFRLGIMTILSMTMLLLSTANDLPRFSNTKIEGQRGSFSSIPLIGIYYLSLLSIIGISTVTSSTFVAIDRFVRPIRVVPWYLAWIAWSGYGYSAASRTEPYDGLVEKLGKPPQDLIWVPPIGLKPKPTTTATTQRRPSEDILLRLHAAVYDLSCSLRRLEVNVSGIRQHVKACSPQEQGDPRWPVILNRLEWLLLFVYLFAITMTIFMFFFHSWWY